MNIKTVCAVVVTYNRKELLVECLDSLRRQSKPLNAIYIIDNASNDGTPLLLLEKGYLNEIPNFNLEEPCEKEIIINNIVDKTELKINYVRMNQNTGGAGGFHEGVKRAYAQDYDWLWLMDDDGEPVKDAFKLLFEQNPSKDISALCCTVKDVNNNIQVVSRGYFNFKGLPLQNILPIKDYDKKRVEIDMASFVGILIRKEAINKIGFPKKEFFIQGDDLEYCINLRSYGKIILITDSIIIHKDQRFTKEIEKTRFFRRSTRPNYKNLWLYYFPPRNLTWIGKNYGKNKLYLYYDVIKSFILVFIGIILYDDNKLKRAYFFYEAYIDGLKGNFDNDKPKNLLY